MALLALGLSAVLPAPLRAQGPVPPPATTPDAQNGLELFAARCASCHGPLGQGDGEMAAQLPVPPAALGSDSYRDQARPDTMFEVITDGILEAGMPPFGPGNSDPLDEQQRWDLVAAIYSLGTSQALFEEGEALYEASCLECHGAEGAGAEGEMELGDQSYWMTRSNEDVAQAMSEVAEHEALALEAEALRTAVNYARTFSYAYTNPLAAFEPIAAAVISGTVTNESRGEPVQEGTPATLSAFTSDFQPSLTMTTTLDAQGQYSFDLTMTPPDLVYVVTVQLDGISYGSDFGRLQREDPSLTLDIPVYDHSTDPSTVAIDQLHIIVQFGDGLVQVSELYQFSQNAPVVFVGQSGQASEGTVRVAVPSRANEPTFDRSFGGMESFFPAENVIPVAGGWADTVPLRPGTSSLNLLVRYTMPYDGELEISHPVHYPVGNVNLVAPDAGVAVSGANWQQEESQNMGEAGVFLSLTQTDVAAGQEVRFALQGTPRETIAPEAGVSLRNPSSELLIGGGVLLLAMALGAFTLYQWRQRDEEEDAWDDEADALIEEASVADEEGALAQRRQALLARIAALDDAFEAGELSQSAYDEQRAALKEALLAIWDR